MIEKIQKEIEKGVDVRKKPEYRNVPQEKLRAMKTQAMKVSFEFLQS